jgi:transposase
MSKKQPTYTADFKRKIAELVESGKSLAEISREYGMSKGTASTWHRQYKTSGSFKAVDNLSTEDKELRQLRKENKRLKMEVDILKQAALILGRNAE